MTRRLITCLATLGLAAVLALTSVAPVSAAEKGRWKKDGDKCVWDANDSGPNQCTPRGRFKKEGGKCVWADEAGPDQCRPAGGRFKKEGNRCVWAAGDSGPDQCDPKRPR